MDDLRAIALEKIINKQIMERKDAIGEEILENCKDTDSMEVIHSKMVFNAIKISIRLSVGLVVDILTGLGLAELANEDKIRKSILEIIK